MRPTNLISPDFPPLSDVVGITNYLDVGFRMATDLGGVQGSVMQLGASWQVRNRGAAERALVAPADREAGL